MDAKCEAAELPAKVEDDFKTRCMVRMRQVPGLGILLALISGICFATAGFTVELMEGVGDDGEKGAAADGKIGVDASIIVACR